jgi:multiple antibiotic resistance protein
MQKVILRLSNHEAKSLFEKFLLAFVPLLIAIDSFGTLPLFLSLTEGENAERRRSIAFESTASALIVGTGFLFGGRITMSFLGITINDFRVAGGIILLCFAVYDLLFSHLQRSMTEQAGAEEVEGSRRRSLAIVPLGIPLTVGPAAMTALLLQAAQFGSLLTLAAFAANILIVYLLFANAARIVTHVPQVILRALSKVVALFLAAIAVMMVRTGLMAMAGK